MNEIILEIIIGCAFVCAFLILIYSAARKGAENDPLDECEANAPLVCPEVKCCCHSVCKGIREAK